MEGAKKYLSGIVLSAVISAAAYLLSLVVPAGILGGTLIALLLGMSLNPLVSRYKVLSRV